MGDANHSRARIQELLEFIQQQLAPVVDGGDAQPCTFFFTQNLPGHDVRMVLHGGNENFITRVYMCAAVSLGYQVDPFGGATYKDDLVGLGGINKVLYRLPGRFVLLCRMLREVMHAAVNVRVAFFVVTGNRVNDNLRLLRGRGVVQINEFLPAHPLGQNRKVAADLLHIEARMYARWTEFPGQPVSDGGHPSSSQFLPWSSPRSVLATGTLLAT